MHRCTDSHNFTTSQFIYSYSAVGLLTEELSSCFVSCWWITHRVGGGNEDDATDEVQEDRSVSSSAVKCLREFREVNTLLSSDSVLFPSLHPKQRRGGGQGGKVMGVDSKKKWSVGMTIRSRWGTLLIHLFSLDSLCLSSAIYSPLVISSDFNLLLQLALTSQLSIFQPIIPVTHCSFILSFSALFCSLPHSLSPSIMYSINTVHLGAHSYSTISIASSSSSSVSTCCVLFLFFFMQAHPQNGWFLNRSSNCQTQICSFHFKCLLVNLEGFGNLSRILGFTSWISGLHK